MKKYALILVFAIFALWACQEATNSSPDAAATATESVPNGAGQSAVQDETSKPDIVKVASANADFSTLVAAVKAADLVNSLSNAGPFTVFAPTNAAFEKLPKGTVDELLKPEKKNDLSNILEYHTYVGVLSDAMLSDGQTFNMVNGKNVSIHIKDGKKFVNDAMIAATVPASNGVIYVIDGVLIPK